MLSLIEMLPDYLKKMTSLERCLYYALYKLFKKFHLIEAGFKLTLLS